MKKSLSFVLILFLASVIHGCYPIHTNEPEHDEIYKSIQGRWNISSFTVTGKKGGSGSLVTYENLNIGTLQISRSGEDRNFYYFIYSPYTNLAVPGTVSKYTYDATMIYAFVSYLEKDKSSSSNYALPYHSEPVYNSPTDYFKLIKTGKNALRIDWYDGLKGETGVMLLVK